LYTLTLFSQDGGDDTITHWTIDWGDGSVETLPGDPSSATHTYNSSGNFIISATATDEDGTWNANMIGVVVGASDPVPAVSGAASTDEGASYALSLFANAPDGAVDSWTIDWGDGVIDTIAGSATSATHVYADGDAAHTITASVLEDGQTYAAPTVDVDVLNVAPVLTIGGNATVDEGDAFVLDLSSVDPGVDTITSWTIDWGDGFVETLSGDPSQATHVFADGVSTASITATATDEDGTYASNTLNLTVTNVAPVVTISGAAQLDEGDVYTLDITTVDPGDDTISQIVVDWGDGNVETFVGSPTQVTHTYADGVSNVSIVATATDEDGSWDSNTLSVTVNNVAPVLTISGAASVDEGDLYALALSVSADPGVDTITEIAVDWGDGTIETFAPGTTQATHTHTHTYADGDSVYSVTATVTDEDGTYASNALSVDVINVAPSLVISGDVTVSEGATYVLSLAASDPGDDTISQWMIDWGDGHVETIAGNQSQVTYVFADGPNTYTISATATDEDGTFSGGSVTVDVLNVAPSVTISGVASVDEGDGYVLTMDLTDPGDDTVTSWEIQWGDGVVETAAGGTTQLSHTYVDGLANVTIVATATDEDGTYAANDLAVSIANVAPTLVISGPTQIDEGAVYTLNLSSSDPGQDVITSWDIDWGDGVVETVAGGTTSVTHTYADGLGQFTITATATDEDGTFASNAIDVTVNNVAPTLTISGDPTTNEGDSYLLTLASSDPGQDTIQSWTIDWGDGAIENYVGDIAEAEHTYVDGPAVHTITATATDEDGTFASNSLVVSVANVAPTLSISGDSEIEVGDTYLLTLASSDPGQDTIQSWTIDWDDGTVESIDGALTSATHIYGTAGDYTITAQATDEDGTYVAANSIAIQALIPPVVLVEQMDFVVEHRQQVVLPAGIEAIRMSFADLIFDSADLDAVNDAFEIALVDSSGNPVVGTIALGRDAFFNITEGENPRLGGGVLFDAAAGAVTVDVTHLSAGMELTLVWRLVNNDSDTTTTATVNPNLEFLAVSPVVDASTASQLLNVDVASSEAIDLDRLSNVTAGIDTSLGLTSFNEDTHILSAGITLENAGT